MKIISWITLLFSLSLFAEDDVVFQLSSKDLNEKNLIHISLKSYFQQTTVDTKASLDTNQTSTSISTIGISPEINYFITPNIALSFAFYMGQDTTSASESSGIEFGGRYYFSNSAISTILESDVVDLIRSPTWAFFGDLHFKSRSIEAETTNIKFSGLSLRGGVDYHLKHNYFLTGLIALDSLTSGDLRTSSAFSFSAGLGIKI